MAGIIYQLLNILSNINLIFDNGKKGTYHILKINFFFHFYYFKIQLQPIDNHRVHGCCLTSMIKKAKKTERHLVLHFL